MSTRAGRYVPAVLAIALLAVACGGTDAETEIGGGGTTVGSPSEPGGDPTAIDPMEAVPPIALGGDPEEACPAPYAATPPSAGLNTDFMSAGQARSFHLLLPADGSTGPRPLMVGLTGTVRPEPDFLDASGLDQLPDDGWIVVAPVRNDNGILWPPWDAMRTPPIADDPNPDQDFIVEVVGCLAAHEDVDANRIYVGGISIGGTMANYLLQRESDLFAGGIVASGNFLTTQPNDPQPLDDMVVIVTWGGDGDVWSGCSDGDTDEPAGEGDEGCVSSLSFVEDASRASQYYSAEPAVAQVACTMDVGHSWLTGSTGYLASALLAHPKGIEGEYRLPTEGAPADLECSTEPFVAEGVTLDG